MDFTSMLGPTFFLVISACCCRFSVLVTYLPGHRSLLGRCSSFNVITALCANVETAPRCPAFCGAASHRHRPWLLRHVIATAAPTAVTALLVQEGLVFPATPARPGVMKRFAADMPPVTPELTLRAPGMELAEQPWSLTPHPRSSGSAGGGSPATSTESARRARMELADRVKGKVQVMESEKKQLHEVRDDLAPSQVGRTAYGRGRAAQP